MFIQWDKFDQLTMGDTGFASELAQVYIEQFKDYVADLNLYVQQSDLENVLFINHKVKSALVVLGMQVTQSKQSQMVEAIQKNQTEKLNKILHSIQEDCQKAILCLRQHTEK